MKPARRGRPASGVELTNVSSDGFWLLLDERKVFVAFKAFPWFRDASRGDIATVRRPSPHHLCWPKLDVDLAVDSLDHPERYPLMSGSDR